jgi:hypothetical protein
MDLYPEINTMVSHITPENLTEEELHDFMDRILQRAGEFEAQGATHIYHILMVSPRGYDFPIGMRNIRAIQQNKALIAMRKRLNVMTILVGQMPKAFQILMTLLSAPTFGGRKMAVFPRLEPALDFVRIDHEAHKKGKSEAAD